MRGCRPLTLEEIPKVVAAMNLKTGLRDRTLFAVGLNTGFRISELLSLTVGDVVTQNGEITKFVSVRRANMKGGKAAPLEEDMPPFICYIINYAVNNYGLQLKKNTKKKLASGRTVILNHSARRALVPWLHELSRTGFIHGTDPLWPSIRTGMALGRIQFWRVLVNAFKAVGLDGRLGTHSMRKTFANVIYEEYLARVAMGEPIDAFRETSKMLGHEVITSTDKYLPVRMSQQQSVIERIGIDI